MKEHGMGDEETIREIISEVDTDNVSLFVFYPGFALVKKTVQSVRWSYQSRQMKDQMTHMLTS
jgi:hypothetical protein